MTRSMHKPIVLATLNSSYFHASFGLRYLYANMGDLQANTELVEYTIAQKSHDLAEDILSRKPKILGLGVYIWNIRETYELVSILKRVQPNLVIVLGGPEVSYETETQSIFQKADYTICGEAEFLFPELCKNILNHSPPSQKKITGSLPEISKLKFPYEYYSNADITTRVVYVEASRGCPFTCEFCLSSLDIPVRQFPLEKFLTAMEGLLTRGAKQFKFVDRTFNLNLMVSRAILQFFLARMRPGLFVHFEMVPDRLPEALRAVIAQFPTGSLQFEVGVQTFDEQTSRNISRRQDHAKLAENLTWLRSHTGVHVHADLIVGLPGEDMPSFARGFDRLVALGPQEIQVGILKRLRGTPIVRHDSEFALRYSAHPPYELLCNRDLDFATMQRLRRFARYWDLVANSGNFSASAPLIWAKPEAASPSPFWTFLAFSDWLFARLGQRHGIALVSLAEALFDYLVTARGVEPTTASAALLADFERTGRRERPAFMQVHTAPAVRPTPTPRHSAAPKRQSRHTPPPIISETASQPEVAPRRT